MGGKPTKSVEEYKRLAALRHGGVYDYSEWPSKVTYGTYLICKCLIHGPFRVSLSNHLSNEVGCRLCRITQAGMSRRLTTQQFIEKSKEVFGDRFNYSNVIYTHNNAKVSIICPKHGVFDQRASSHMEGYNGCDKCERHDASIKNRKDVSIFHTQMIQRYRDRFTFDAQTYVNAKTPIKLFCTTHSVEFFATPDNLLNKASNCPNCSSHSSSPEALIAQMVKEWGFTVERHKRLPSKKHIDIYIPERLIGIEYNGLYWHSDRMGKNRNYHLQKLTDANNQGIRLITVFEDEWNNNQKIVENKLKSILGCCDLEKLSARQCSVRTISQDAAKLFLNQYHIQGNGPGRLCYGLFHDTELVAVMKFIQTGQVFTLNRYATSASVRGGFSKILSYFRTNNVWQKIITFADRRWSEGKLYQQVGFVCDAVLPQDYAYVYQSQRVHKFNFRHKNLPKILGEKYDPALSERENMAKSKYARIWNCGLLRFVMENPVNKYNNDTSFNGQ